MKTILKKVVPPGLHPVVRRSFQRVAHFGIKRNCPICGSWLNAFLPHGNEQGVVCPVCFSKAPHRLSCLFFKCNPHVFRKDGLILHIAAEPGFERRFRQWAGQNRMSYRKGDIEGQGTEHLDVCRLPFADGSIDLIYCCHVLNMVRDDRLAIRELFRVLVPHGAALLQVPCFYTGPTTKETSDTDEDRQRSFNDSRMFRVYTDADYQFRLEAAGFVVERYLADNFPAPVAERCGLWHEVVHVCRKPAAERFPLRYATS